MYVIIIVLAVGIILLSLLVVKSYREVNVLSPRLSELASAFQNFAVILSIIGTAAWAIYTFEALNQKDQAELKYEELQKKIRDTESTTIEISTSVVNYSPVNEDEHKGLIIEVNIINKGSKRIEYDLTDKPLKVYKVEALGDKLGYTKLMQPTLYSKVAPLGQKDVLSTPLNKWISLTESSRKLSYFVTVEPNSLYYIVFSSSDSENEHKPKEEINGNDTEVICDDIDKCKWFVSKYIFTDVDNGNVSNGK
jgi:hypothetical protein